MNNELQSDRSGLISFAGIVLYALGFLCIVVGATLAAFVSIDVGAGLVASPSAPVRRVGLFIVMAGHLMTGIFVSILLTSIIFARRGMLVVYAVAFMAIVVVVIATNQYRSEIVLQLGIRS